MPEDREPTLDATVAGAASNTYVAWADAEAYFRALLEYEDWTAFTRAQQMRGLTSASKAIDNLIRDSHLDGVRYDLTTPQALLFPRSDDYDIDGELCIPPDIVTATCLLALHLLAKRYRPEPIDAGAMREQGVRSVAADGLSLGIGPGRETDWPLQVMRLVGQFYRKGGPTVVGGARSRTWPFRDWSNDGVVQT